MRSKVFMSSTFYQVTRWIICQRCGDEGLSSKDTWDWEMRSEASLLGNGQRGFPAKGTSCCSEANDWVFHCSKRHQKHILNGHPQRSRAAFTLTKRRETCQFCQCNPLVGKVNLSHVAWIPWSWCISDCQTASRQEQLPGKPAKVSAPVLQYRKQPVRERCHGTGLV